MFERRAGDYDMEWSRFGPWGRQQRRQRRPLVGLEQLEGRQLLAAASTAPSAHEIESIEWQGRAIEARVDHWVGRLAVPTGMPMFEAQLSGRYPGWHAASLGDGFFSLSTPEATRQTVLNWAADTSAVARLEPDLAVHATAIPNDPLFSSQWGLQNVGQYSTAIGADIQATQAWNVTTGSRNVVVAVIDSGIDITHPDLAANIWTNPGDAAGQGVDSDNNGYVDDIHGWNFVDNNNDVSDGYGHGTHVAGIIGAVGNNGIGVSGVNWQVSLMVLKIQDSRGIGYTSSVIAALNYITMMRRDHGINIVAANASWVSAAGYSVVVQEAIRAEGAVGVTFVAAAGNNASNNDVIPRYPAGYDLPNVITVAALSESNTLAAMSNYGAVNVDLAAPGTLIKSTFPGGNYGFLSGSSMATPQVTGVVALLAAAKPGISVAEVRSAILGTTTPVANLVGKTVTGGRLNAFAALASIGATAPQSAPVSNPPTAAQRDWVQAVGRITISANTASSSVAGNSVMVLRGLSVADVHLRATVAVRAVTGQAVGLVARYSGPSDRNMYLGRLVKQPAGYVGQIWRNVGGVWRLLAARAVPRSSGLLQFDVVGNSLTLSFDGRKLISVRDNALSRPGTAGMRITGITNRVDNFLAT
ncbi:MAG: S8 family peptidase [Planctomycetota bacterium]